MNFLMFFTNNFLESIFIFMLLLLDKRMPVFVYLKILEK